MEVALVPLSAHLVGETASPLRCAELQNDVTQMPPSPCLERLDEVNL